MDIKKERRKIYLRCFALLLALWLALMSVFTWHLLQDAHYDARQRFVSAAQTIQSGFVSAWKEADYVLEESIWQSQVSIWQNGGFTAALFSYEGEPVWIPQEPSLWTVCLSRASEDGWISATIDPARWFDFSKVSKEMNALTFPQHANLLLEDVLLTEDGEAIPKTMLLRYNYDTVATFTNSNFSQYEGEIYTHGSIDFPANALEAVDAVQHREEIQKMRDIVANSAPSLIGMRLDDPRHYNITNYTINNNITYRFFWDTLDRVFMSVVGFGPVVGDTWRDTPDSLPISYSHPTYWLVLAGRSDVWSSAGIYWLSSLLISLLGFLAAAWLLSHMSWKGQKAHLLYERRTQETANAIAHDLKTPMSVLHASAENLAANICPEKQGVYIAEITRQTAAMDQVLLDLLDLAAGNAPNPSEPQ